MEMVWNRQPTRPTFKAPSTTSSKTPSSTTPRDLQRETTIPQTFSLKGIPTRYQTHLSQIMLCLSIPHQGCLQVHQGDLLSKGLLQNTLGFKFQGWSIHQILAVSRLVDFKRGFGIEFIDVVVQTISFGHRPNH